MYGIGDYLLDCSITAGYGAAIGVSGAIAVASGGAAIPTTIGLSCAAANHIKNVHKDMKQQGVNMKKW